MSLPALWGPQWSTPRAPLWTVATGDGPSGTIQAPVTAPAFAALGITAPGSVYGCQEASGNLTDAIGGITLTKNSTGHLYQQSVSGWSRKFIATVDGTANQKWVNTTTAPSAAATSLAWLAYVRTPSAAPAATRTLMTAGTTLEHRVASGLLKARLTVQAINTDSASNFADGTVRPVLIVYDRTGLSAKLYTDQDVVTGTYSAAVIGPNLALGAGGSTAANAGFGWAALWSGANAEVYTTTANARALLVALGWTIPW